MEGERLARFLGWASVALGIPPLLAPNAFARAIGVRGTRNSTAIAPLIGVRELASAAGILTQSQPLPWVWVRVAGDAMDLVLLGGTITSPNARTNRVAVAMVAVLGITILDIFCSLQLRDDS